MTASRTARLGLDKPNPGTGENVNVASINASFDKIDAAIGATEVTSGARPTSPFRNQFIRETDTRRLYVWNPTQNNWDQVLIDFTGNNLSLAGALTVAGTMTASGALAVTGGLTVAGLDITGSENGISNAVITGSAGSSSYVNISTPSSFSFVKKKAGTRIRVDISLSCFPSVSNVLTELGVRINAVDYDCIRHRHTAVEYETITGWDYISGVPAGTFTVQGRWSSSATTQTDAATSWLCMSAREVD